MLYYICLHNFISQFQCGSIVIAGDPGKGKSTAAKIALGITSPVEEFFFSKGVRSIIIKIFPWSRQSVQCSIVAYLAKINTFCLSLALAVASSGLCFFPHSTRTSLSAALTVRRTHCPTNITPAWLLLVLPPAPLRPGTVRVLPLPPPQTGSTLVVSQWFPTRKFN